jgi:hypothetical protein
VSPKSLCLGSGLGLDLRLSGLLSAAAITPLDGGEIDHPSTDEDKKDSSRNGQHVVEREAGNNNVVHDQKLMVPSPLRPHTTMAIEKVNTAQRAAQPAVISMKPRKMWPEFNQRRGAQ